MITDLTFVFYCIPETEVATRFEVECCILAIHHMMSLADRFKEIGKAQGLELAKGILTAGASLSAGPIVNPLIDTAVKSFKERNQGWYFKIAEIRKAFLPVITAEGLNAERIQEYLREYKKSSEKAVCLAQIFTRIILDRESTPELKRMILGVHKEIEIPCSFRILGEFDPVLEGRVGRIAQGFSHIETGLRVFDSYWKARRIAYKALSQFRTARDCDKTDREKINEFLFARFSEPDPRAGAVLLRNFERHPEKGNRNLNSSLVDLGEIKKRDEEERREIESPLQKIQATKESKDKEISEKRARGNKHSGGGVGRDIDPRKIPEQIENLETELRALESKKIFFEEARDELIRYQETRAKYIEEIQASLAKELNEQEV